MMPSIHDILVREHSTNTKLDSQIEDLNDEVINLIKSDAVKDNKIEDLERRIKKQLTTAASRQSSGPTSRRKSSVVS
jgi:chaperonin cofactor prefoldin